jgi:hypothetical protein
MRFECINPIAFSTLIRHHREKGSGYWLYARRYGLWMFYEEKPVPIRVLIPKGNFALATAIDDATFVRAHRLLGFMEPSTTDYDLIWELATTAGLYCRKVEIIISEESEWTTADEHSLMSDMVEVSRF